MVIPKRWEKVLLHGEVETPARLSPWNIRHSWGTGAFTLESLVRQVQMDRPAWRTSQRMLDMSHQSTGFEQLVWGLYFPQTRIFMKTRGSRCLGWNRSHQPMSFCSLSGRWSKMNLVVWVGEGVDWNALSLFRPLFIPLKPRVPLGDKLLM